MNSFKISTLPVYRNLIASTTRIEGEFPKKRILALFEYPDCFRIYDGSKWIVEKKEEGDDLMTFEAEMDGK